MAMYYLIDNYTDDIIDKIDSVTPGGAEHYFIGRKKMVDMKQEFHKIWRIVKKKDYELQFELNQKNSLKQYQWWKEEPIEPDEGFDH
jgi:hypothetical protein